MKRSAVGSQYKGLQPSLEGRLRSSSTGGSRGQRNQKLLWTRLYSALGQSTAQGATGPGIPSQISPLSHAQTMFSVFSLEGRWAQGRFSHFLDSPHKFLCSLTGYLHLIQTSTLPSLPSRFPLRVGELGCIPNVGQKIQNCSGLKKIESVMWWDHKHRTLSERTKRKRLRGV